MGTSQLSFVHGILLSGAANLANNMTNSTYDERIAADECGPSAYFWSRDTCLAVQW